MPNNIVFTGEPGSGKSSLIRSLIDGIEPKIGIVEREITELENGKQVRVGFLMMNYKGEHEILAHKHMPSGTPIPSRSGNPYFVQEKALNRLVKSVGLFGTDDLLFLDEIGLMESSSPIYQALVRSYLDAPNLFVGTIGTHEHPFLEEIKARDDVKPIRVHRDNSSRLYTRFRPKLEEAARD